MFILTTPEGADLPASASVENFPLLVRIHKDYFDFSKAKANGDDLRFSTSDGKSLAYQIDEWDPKTGVASIWVRIPKITGNARQEIKLHWGKADAKGESDGKAVFNDSNGYLSVWHMNDAVKDEVGTLESKDTGTTPSTGIVGQARYFPGMKGVFCGEKILNYPAGADSHSTEMWFRAEKSNVTLIGWGNEPGGRGSKVRMLFRSPSHIRIDSNFSDVKSEGRIPLGEWTHVVHTYVKGEGKVYINGKPDGSAKPMLNIASPARLWLGGWYNNYDFVGDMDEVRISKVTRSAEWIKLQYENTKPLQTLVGPIVQAGNEFGLPETAVAVPEGKSLAFKAKAGGAQKVYWILKRDGKESIMATDRMNYTFDAGRVVGDQSASLQFKAVYANEVKTKTIPITIKEDIPEPEFKLEAPTEWDGRKQLDIIPKLSNMAAMKAKGAGMCYAKWSVSGMAVRKEEGHDRLMLLRAHNSGPMVVTVSIDNGGAATTRSITINVKEPAKDAWGERKPEKDEKPEEGQFYPRNDKNEGVLYYNGTHANAGEKVTLKLFADDKLVNTEMQTTKDDKSYAFAVKLKAGLIKYKVEFSDSKKVVNTVGNIVCGDVYLIDGQSNAEALDIGKEDPTFTSDFIRSYGNMNGSPVPAGQNNWCNAMARNRQGGKGQIGYWGMELAKRLMETHKMPICILNGAVGGSRIDVHQRNNVDPTDAKSIYGRLLGRVREAKLTHGVRAVLWHQGENDQGADGPTGGYGYETYQQLFVDLAGSWKYDYPNIQHYYVFQIWPKACAMGINGSDNRLREVQRNLPKLFSNLSVMSTVGIVPPGGCHYPKEGYAEFARLIAPLVERDIYGKVPTTSITAPNLKSVGFSNDKKDELTLEFDQPVKWDDTLTGQFFFDGEKGKVATGSVTGNTLKLKLTGPATAKTITYLDSAAWSQDKLLRGTNGIAALTFCEVPIAKP